MIDDEFCTHYREPAGVSATNLSSCSSFSTFHFASTGCITSVIRFALRLRPDASISELDAPIKVCAASRARLTMKMAVTMTLTSVSTGARSYHFVVRRLRRRILSCTACMPTYSRTTGGISAASIAGRRRSQSERPTTAPKACAPWPRQAPDERCMHPKRDASLNVKLFAVGAITSEVYAEQLPAHTITSKLYAAVG